MDNKNPTKNLGCEILGLLQQLEKYRCINDSEEENLRMIIKGTEKLFKDVNFDNISRIAASQHLDLLHSQFDKMYNSRHM